MIESSKILKAYFKTKIEITDEEFDYWFSFFIYKELKKHKFILTEGQHCNKLIFVTSGCLRSFTIDSKGDEHILQFAPVNWWISDLNSFSNSVASHSNIDAVVDSTILKIEKPAYDHLAEANPKWNLLFVQLLQNNRAATEKRIISSLSLPAEERYSQFLKTYSTIASQIPLHMVASYLGITPESLSRIRKHISDSK